MDYMWNKNFATDTGHPKAINCLICKDFYMGWTKPEYSLKKVDRAGALLSAIYNGKIKYEEVNSEELDKALTILSNWRSAHSFPLNTLQMHLRKLAKGIDTNALIVQRLKRVSSILYKLGRKQTHTMKLSQMQDIGGCRAIVSSLQAVRDLEKLYDQSQIKHKPKRKDDYISKPKEDGYRSIHFVYKYFSDKNKVYNNGIFIEIQIRSKLQHAWATAVETVGTFTKHAYKSDEGDVEWQTFFRLASAAFAFIEKTPQVPNTPTDIEELRSEIKDKILNLKVFQRMRGFAAAFQEIRETSAHHFFLLDLDIDKEQLKISSFPRSAEKLAVEAYDKAENEIKQIGDKKIQKDAVLVAADSVEELRKAYPNYFADTSAFISYLENFLENKSSD
ncbi:MAG: RelA/SpoT domain-containing protein [Candidatus Marsarchaeota archaeon]|nr:RelA/SpoT domain-containing protein [Candidatus Marsarchaeota archaeon]